MKSLREVGRRVRDAVEARLPAEWHFARIYKGNIWRGKESRSGTGSDLEQTRVVRQGLPELLRQIRAASILDLPCGDFHWMKEVDLPVQSYIGGDLLPELIKKNSQLYASEIRRFFVLDVRRSKLPQVDVVFCRDCLVHLSNADVFSALRNIKMSGASYLIATTFPMRDANIDIRTSGWRPLNLIRPPFCLSSPIELLNEGCTEDNGVYADKSLGLWRVQDLPDSPTHAEDCANV
jgi:SAM-dependent methyltransferase